MMGKEGLNKTQLLVSHGFMALAVLLVTMLISELMQAAIKTDFSEFVYHPGPAGLGALCVVLSLYVFMSILVRIVDVVWFRWLTSVLLLIATMFFLKHQISHIMDGRVYGIYGVLDVTHHIVGFFTTYIAVCWARSGKTHSCELQEKRA